MTVYYLDGYKTLVKGAVFWKQECCDAVDGADFSVGGAVWVGARPIAARGGALRHGWEAAPRRDSGPARWAHHDNFRVSKVLSTI